MIFFFTSLLVSAYSLVILSLSVRSAAVAVAYLDVDGNVLALCI
jgi:hypothetical protein